jgi:hypothetical protein
MFAKIDSELKKDVDEIDEANRKCILDTTRVRDRFKDIVGKGINEITTADELCKQLSANVRFRDAPLYAALRLLDSALSSALLDGRLNDTLHINKLILECFNMATFVPVDESGRKNAMERYGSVFVKMQQSSLSRKNILNAPEEFVGDKFVLQENVKANLAAVSVAAAKLSRPDFFRHQLSVLPSEPLLRQMKNHYDIVEHVIAQKKLGEVVHGNKVDWLEVENRIEEVIVDDYFYKLRAVIDALYTQLANKNASCICAENRGANDGTYYESCHTLATCDQHINNTRDFVVRAGPKLVWETLGRVPLSEYLSSRAFNSTIANAAAFAGRHNIVEFCSPDKWRGRPLDTLVSGAYSVSSPYLPIRFFTMVYTGHFGAVRQKTDKDGRPIPEKQLTWKENQGWVDLQLRNYPLNEDLHVEYERCYNKNGGSYYQG